MKELEQLKPDDIADIVFRKPGRITASDLEDKCDRSIRAALSELDDIGVDIKVVEQVYRTAAQEGLKAYVFDQLNEDPFAPFEQQFIMVSSAQGIEDVFFSLASSYEFDPHSFLGIFINQCGERLYVAENNSAADMIREAFIEKLKPAMRSITYAYLGTGLDDQINRGLDPNS